MLNNGAHHRIFDLAVMQIDADFVTGAEVPVSLLLARHGGRFYRSLLYYSEPTSLGWKLVE